ncbi:MAG: radical SAM protein [Myxococcota bacterium]
MRSIDLRLLARLGAAAADPYRPLLAQIVITRRCNLACGYCYEYDHVSPPIPRETLLERFDHLARLRAVFVTLNGGEPLTHPDVVQLVADLRDRGAVPMINTNAFLLTADLVRRLGDAARRYEAARGLPMAMRCAMRRRLTSTT